MIITVENNSFELKLNNGANQELNGSLNGQKKRVTKNKNIFFSYISQVNGIWSVELNFTGTVRDVVICANNNMKRS